MPWPIPQDPSCLYMTAVVLVAACAVGDNSIGASAFTGAPNASVGNSDAMTGSEGDTGGPGDTEHDPSASSQGTQDGTTTSDSAAGNALCCEVRPLPGCHSDATEECVCAIEPACCTAVWSQICVEQAIACGDPWCVDEPGTTSGEGSSGEDTAQPLLCDPDFVLSPDPPLPGAPFQAAFTDPEPWPYIGMHATDAGGRVVQGVDAGISTSDPWTWNFSFDGLSAGLWTVTFTRNMGVSHATCQLEI